MIRFGAPAAGIFGEGHPFQPMHPSGLLFRQVQRDLGFSVREFDHAGQKIGKSAIGQNLDRLAKFFARLSDPSGKKVCDAKEDARVCIQRIERHGAEAKINRFVPLAERVGARAGVGENRRVRWCERDGAGD